MDWCKAYGELHRWDLFAEDWLKLTGGQRLTFEILAFMIDEARLMAKPHSSAEADRELARRLVAQLGEVASLTLTDGFPAHMILPSSKGDGDWRRREIFQRNAETSLYAAMHAWAEAGYPCDLIGEYEAEGGWHPGMIKVAWREEVSRPVTTMLSRLGYQLADNTLATQLFARWDFCDETFGIIDLTMFNLFGANLRGAGLSRAGLFGADLRWTDLRGAYLKEALLMHANLSGANLEEALMQGADLEAVDLSGANLERAELQGADLEVANLGGVNLVRADMVGANLEGANLRGADLEGANLIEANFSRADLRGSINLTQLQIDLAYGNSQTKLPEGMAFPEDRLLD